MRAWLRRGDFPLFLRIFGLMLLTLFLIQALNFAVVVLTPPPQPTITTIDHLVALLRGTAKPGERLVVQPGAIDMPDRPRGREINLLQQVARRLDVPEEDVRVRFLLPSPNAGPPLLGPGGPIRRFRRRDLPPNEAGELLLFGDFAISARLNGRWRTVALNSPGALWRLRTYAWLAIALIVVAAVAWFLARAAARPIDLFAEAARRLGRNPRAPPLDLRGPPEIREAAIAFNEMQGRLNRYVEDRTTLMAAIAHDLRTPLMRLSLRLEHAPEAVRRDCETDVRDMEQMIDAVMSFVRDMARPSRRQRLDLRSLAESVTDEFVDAGGTVRLGSGDPLIVEGDPPALKAVLNNLINNAVKYADGAAVSLRAEDGLAIIEVADSGPGMVPEDLDRAFDPFFRAERSRNKDTGGIGLGLASVRAVARAHGGDAMLANRPEGGLVARVQLPL